MNLQKVLKKEQGKRDRDEPESRELQLANIKGQITQAMCTKDATENRMMLIKQQLPPYAEEQVALLDELQTNLVAIIDDLHTEHNNLSEPSRPAKRVVVENCLPK